MKPLLSVCMIVKDEEKVLSRCLESIHGVADEIIVVDTGSQDRTKEIAMRYTDKVFDFEWINDFSKARNYAASKATGEWIFVIDADEFVDKESFKKFKQELEKNPPKNSILSIQIVSFTGENAKDTSLNYHDRIYKNDGNISYQRPVHEVLVHKDLNENNKREIVDFQIFHTGYMTDVVKGKNKSERNLNLLLNKKDKEAIDYFFIGNEYKSRGEIDKAINFYQKAYQLKKDIHLDWVRRLLFDLVDCLHEKKRDKEALDIIHSCEQVFPNLVDFKFYKGIIFYNKEQYKTSKKILENILSEKDKLVSFRSPDFLEYWPLKILGNIYEKENELHKAVHCYSKALSINDADDELWSKLIFLLGKHSSLKELAEFLNRNVVNKQSMTPQRMIKILLNVPILDVQKLSRSLLDESELSQVENEALFIKNLYLDGQIDEVIAIFENKDINEVVSILKTRIFNLSDMLLIALESEHQKCKEILFQINYDESINNILNMLFFKKNKKLTDLEESLFLSIYSQANVLGNDKIVKLLNGRKAFISKQGRKKISEMIS